MLYEQERSKALVQLTKAIKVWLADDVEAHRENDRTGGMSRSDGTPFQWLAILTPRRVWNEDVGDALETITAMRRAGCSNLQVRAKIVSTYFWVFIAVIRELIAALTGRKSPHK